MPDLESRHNRLNRRFRRKQSRFQCSAPRTVGPLFPFFPYLPLLCVWVSAEPAAVLAALLAPELVSAFDAAVAARDDVTLEVLLWDRADPAADFADLLEPLSSKTFEADDAARLLVTSDLAILSLQLQFQIRCNVIC